MASKLTPNQIIAREEEKRLKKAKAETLKKQKQESAERAKIQIEEAKRKREEQALVKRQLDEKIAQQKSQEIAEEKRLAEEKRREEFRLRDEQRQLQVAQQKLKKEEAEKRINEARTAKDDKQFKEELKHKTDYAIAKHGHKIIKEKTKIEKWRKEDEFAKRPRLIRAITKRKGNKRGSSIVGQGISKILYPVKPLKRKRW